MNVSLDNVNSNISSQWESAVEALKSADSIDNVSFNAETRALTFSVNDGNAVQSISLSMPELDVPQAADDGGKIASLCAKLGTGDLMNLSPAQVETVCNELIDEMKSYADALAAGGASGVDTSGNSTTVMFDLYALMALLVECGQKMRDAARDVRQAENEQVQTSIQNQADQQRSASLTGLIASVAVCVIQVGMQSANLARLGKGISQQNTARNESGIQNAQSDLKMAEMQAKPQDAQANLQKVTAATDPAVKAKVEGTFNDSKVTKGALVSDAELQQRIETNTAELNSLKAIQNGQPAQVNNGQPAQVNNGQPAQVNNGQPAQVNNGQPAQANNGQPAQVNNDQPAQANNGQPAQANNDQPAQANNGQPAQVNNDQPAQVNNGQPAQANNGQPAQAGNAQNNQAAPKLTEAQQARMAELESQIASDTKMKSMSFDDRQSLYRTQVKSELADIRNNPNATKAEIKYAEAYAANELAQNSTPQQLAGELAAAQANFNQSSALLQHSDTYLKGVQLESSSRIYGDMIMAIGNVAQGCVSSMTEILKAEATEMGAEQQASQEMLDQAKDLFSQCQSLIDSVVQLMQAVLQAEVQSMRDAIQA